MSCGISIIIPVYNVAPYLRQCLDSVVNQTFRDVEVICIDDGSTDGSGAILDEYAAVDGRFRVLHQGNMGQYPTRNVSLQHVRGRYLLFVDSDDWIDPELCRKAFYRAESTEADIVVHLWQYVCSDREPPEWGCLTLDGRATPACGGVSVLEYGYLWMKLYRTEFIRRHLLKFDERYYSKADVIFHWQATSLARKVVLLPELLYYYRVHDTSITATIGERYLEIIDVMFALKRVLADIGDPKGLLPCYWPRFALRFIYSAYKQSSPKLRKEMRRRIRAALGDEERRFYRQRGNLSDDARYFYLSLESGLNDWRYNRLQGARRNITSAIKRLLLPKWLRTTMLQVIRSQSYTLRHSPAETLRELVEDLNAEIARLCEENYKLREDVARAANPLLGRVARTIGAIGLWREPVTTTKEADARSAASLPVVFFTGHCSSRKPGC